MSKKSALPMILALTMIIALVPTGFTFASSADYTLTSVVRQVEPVTLYTTDSAEISTIDPQRATDVISINVIENLFLGLTNNDPLVPGNVLPEVATDWTVSDDGLVWTFNLRNDIPWVRWDPVNDNAEIMRMVTAHDFEYAIKRSCDPNLASYYSSLNSQMIAGCDVPFNTPVEELTPELFDAVQAVALDDVTFQITLQFSAGYFLPQTGMWQNRAVPEEVISEYGENWTDVGVIWTNGPFVIDELVRGVRRVYLRNPHLPADIQGPGNLERIVTTVVEDQGTRFSLYQDNQIDVSGVPTAELQAILDDPAYEGQLFQVADLGVFYFAYAHDKAPFDNVHARRAFSAAIDRNAFVQEIRQNRGVPMIHFTPPGMFGAPPVNEVGVGYNPEYARQQIELAGYPNCEGFPTIEFIAQSGIGSWGECLAASVERELGCDPNIMTIEQQEFSVILETTSAQNATEDRPNIWTAGWGPDYPDANNWVNDVLSCEGQNDFKRPCTETDDLIQQAARESDPAVRQELYYRIEEQFFGEDGDFPIAPLFLRLDYVLIKPWYKAPVETDGLFGGAHWDWRTIDQEAQLAARGG